MFRPTQLLDGSKAVGRQCADQHQAQQAGYRQAEVPGYQRTACQRDAAGQVDEHGRDRERQQERAIAIDPGASPVLMLIRHEQQPGGGERQAKDGQQPRPVVEELSVHGAVPGTGISSSQSVDQSRQRYPAKARERSPALADAATSGDQRRLMYWPLFCWASAARKAAS